MLVENTFYLRAASSHTDTVIPKSVYRTHEACLSSPQPSLGPSSAEPACPYRVALFALRISSAKQLLLAYSRRDDFVHPSEVCFAPQHISTGLPPPLSATVFQAVFSH